MATAKLFRSGGSQAVRLPKQFRFPGTEVEVQRTGEGVLLKSVLTDDERYRLFVELGGSCPDFPLPEPAPPPRIVRKQKKRRRSRRAA